MSLHLNTFKSYLSGAQQQEAVNSRALLRRLDRVIGFPEEGALMLANYEFSLLGQTSTAQLLRGLARVLGRKPGQDFSEARRDRYSFQALLQFQKIVSHFYLVSSLLLLTVWKFHDFSITQILREINFGGC